MLLSSAASERTSRFMINRRRFLQCIAIAAASPPLARTVRAGDLGTGPLRPDPGELLDLPDGFSYRIVSRAGDTMDDGLRCRLLTTAWQPFPVLTAG
jgi:hypothetical protein